MKDQLVTYWVQEAKNERNITDMPHLEDQLPEDVVQMSQRQLQPIEKINPFLTLDGMYILMHVVRSSTHELTHTSTKLQALIRIETVQSNLYTPYSWGS